jgi:hydrogenase-4 component E
LVSGIEGGNLDTVNTAFSILILLSAFVLMAGKRIKSYISAMRLQTLLLAAATAAVGIGNLKDKGGIDLLVVSVIIVALKTIYIPHMLHKTWAQVEYKVEKDFLMNIPALVLLCCGIVVLTYFTLPDMSKLTGGPSRLLLVNSISLTLIGLFFIISRRKAIGQIVGLLVIENGLFATALYGSNGMPFIVDMGIFVDLITSVLILGVMVFRINDRFETIDIDKLNNLRG